MKPIKIKPNTSFIDAFYYIIQFTIRLFCEHSRTPPIVGYETTFFATKFHK